MLRTIAIVVALLGGLLGTEPSMVATARADDAPEAPAETESVETRARAALDRLGLSGSLAFDYYSSNHDIDDRDNFPGLNLILKHRAKLAPGIRWFAEARVLAEQVGHEHEDATHGSPRSLRYADEVTSELREGYVEVSREAWEMRVGRQIIPWGRGDEINPTDVISPKNYTLLLPEGSPEYRGGVNAFRLDAFLPWNVRAIGVYVPFFEQTIIPLSDPPEGARVDDRLPALTFENGSAGIKLDRSGGKVDASIAYYYGFNLLPEVRIARAAADPLTGALTADVDLAHGRQHMIGADFATAAGRFGYRGEVAWVQTDNPHARRVESVVPYLSYVLGIERSFSNSLSVIVQYTGRYVPDRIDPERALENNSDPVLAQAKFLAARSTVVINQQLDTVQNGWSLRLDKKFWNDTLDCELLGVHYFERNDFFVRPRVAYDWTDAWKTSIGGEVFHGPNNSTFGRIERNTGGFVEVKYSF
jgi:hypothetical protein